MPTDKLDRAIEIMISADRKHRHLIDSCVRDIGIQQTRHRILMHLARHKMLPSQKELAEHLKVTPAAVTLALKKLETDGYIEKSLGHDNRYNEIMITDKGRGLVNRTKDAFSETDRAVFEGFSEEELDDYIRLLQKMQTNMDNYENMKGRRNNEKMV